MKTLLFVSFVLAGSLAFGTVRYVDDAAGVDDTSHGTAPENAYKTIQYAVDRSSSGDTIKVLPGVYDEGGYTPSSIANQARININKSNLTIVSTDGKAVTHIVGAADFRCVRMPKGCSGIVIRDFTIRDGSGVEVDVEGAGVFSHANNTNYVVDCVISNCVGSNGGAVYGAALLRSRVTTCRASGGIVRGSLVMNSVFDANLNSSPVLYHCGLYNATFVANRASDGTAVSSARYATAGFPTLVHNCLFVYDNPSTPGAGGLTLTNCVLSGASADHCVAAVDTLEGQGDDMMMAPAFDDWRLLDGHAAVTKGCAEVLAEPYLMACVENDRYLDFNGSPIPTTGAITVGAIQTTATKVTGFDFSNATEINGRAWTFETSPHVYFDDAASRFLNVRALNGDASGQTVFGYVVGGETASKMRVPEPDGSVWLRTSPEGVKSVSTYFASQILYVSEDGNDEDNDGTAAVADGSGAGPKRTIQAAVDAAPEGDTPSISAIIYVAPGTYATGGAFGYGLQNRVCISNHLVRLQATGGAANTVIVGGTDCRCVATYSRRSSIVGFTLTGGRTLTEGTSDESQSGGAFYTQGSQYPYVVDCILSNNCARFGAAAYNGFLQRCRIVENHVLSKGQFVVRGSVLSSCVIGDTIFDASCHGDLGRDAKAYHCIIRGGTQSAFRSTGIGFYNSILASGCNTEADSVNIAGSLFDASVTDTKGLTGYVSGDAGLESAASGRLTSFSDAIGLGTVSCSDAYCQWVTTDIDNNPIVADADGKVNAGPFASALMGVRVSGRYMTPEPGTYAVDPGGSLVVSTRAGDKLKVDGAVLDQDSFTFTAEDRAYAKGETHSVERVSGRGMTLIFR